LYTYAVMPSTKLTRKLVETEHSIYHVYVEKFERILRHDLIFFQRRWQGNILLYVHIAWHLVPLDHLPETQSVARNGDRPVSNFHQNSEFAWLCVSHEVHMHDTIAMEGKNFFGWCLESEITRATTLRSAVDKQLYSSNLSWSSIHSFGLTHRRLPWRLTHARYDSSFCGLSSLDTMCRVERFLASRLPELVSACIVEK
jgi:hypothetical protein